MMRLVVLVVLLAGMLESCSAISMRLGDFGDNYVAYMTYTMRGYGRVSLDLFDYNGYWPLHVNPRYGSDGPSCRSVLVLNNRVNKQWQRELRPSSFLFRYNQKTTMVVKPMATEYKITFDYGQSSYRSFTFPFRNGHKPNQCNKLMTHKINSPYCPSKQVPPSIHNAGVGYHIKSLSVGRKIHVIGIAPTTGNIIVDITRGPPEKKSTAHTPLRIHATFGTKNVVYFKSGARGVFKTLKQVNNGIRRQQYFVEIEVTQSSYRIKECGQNLQIVKRVDCEDNGEATIWVSGAKLLDKIAVY